MGLPQVVIVGRPNVGKSSLFNWLARRRLAIVDKTAGVTRDRLTYLMDVNGRYFELVDTGGLGFEDPDNLTAQIEEQINAALEQAAVILMVVDAREGLTSMDQDVAKRLRYVQAPIVCVANKADDASIDPNADEFYKLGRGKLLCTSTQQNRHREELLELIVERLPQPPAEDTEPPADAEMKVAIVGRRNVGKSTFVNTIAQAERHDCQRSSRHHARQRRREVRAGWQSLCRHRYSGFKAGPQHRQRRGILQPASRTAERATGRCRAVAFRLCATDQQS